ncbi:Transcription termination factor MTEF1, chloroplastic [Vitis vinifera]|uniref:Transcription termination factor MTEF1, chloroplastic n=1 Tax=Vitis vinifera TaxID=29760 RepID=A0A438KD83_VITVI|nr:Transcription termination factor MTEF1, chloroplastic [Vitis vinifera]
MVAKGRFFSSSSTSPSSPNPNQYSFTVSYLTNSCGLSPQSALSASQKLRLVTPERPDSVLTLLRNYGITDAQLPKLLRVFPSLLLADPEKTLLPKLEFLHSKAFTRADLGRILSSCPLILSRSLDNQIIPCHNFLKSILRLDKTVVSACKRSPRILLENVKKNIVPKITALQEIGVPQSSVVFLIKHYPYVVQLKNDKFHEIVKEVMESGFDPLKMVFITAIQVFAGMSKSTWEQKWRFTGVDFLVNKMGWKLSAIIRVPITLGYSLEKRIIPRCSVGKVLILKGFVIKYQNHIPQLLNLYKGEVGVLELGFASEEICGIKQL